MPYQFLNRVQHLKTLKQARREKDFAQVREQLRALSDAELERMAESCPERWKEFLAKAATDDLTTMLETVEVEHSMLAKYNRWLRGL
jgi:hypothetical protein